MLNNSPVCRTTSATFVIRATIAYPANINAIRYLRGFLNLADDGEIDWTKTVTYALPLLNDFCGRRLARNLPADLTEEVHGDAVVTRVELFDPNTHRLLFASN
jgi:hypothetical protein